MRNRRIVAVLIPLALAFVACGDDSGDVAEPTTAGPTTTAAPVTTAAPAEPLDILVTNDDGIGGAGLDVLVQALETVPDVEVTIVAPATDQSGTSDSTTEGELAFADATTLSGIPGTAVEGFPADTIAVALDELGLEPDLVVSGINKGQNIGPFVAVSGTVGAARAAVRRGIPAVAVSAGIDNASADYDGAAELVLDWIGDNRDVLRTGTAPTDYVVNFNVPTCTAGTPGALLEVPVATAIPEGVDVFNSDCSVASDTTPADDVAAIAAGYRTISEVPPDL